MSDAGFFFPYQADTLLGSLAPTTLEGDSVNLDMTNAGALWSSQFNAIEDYLGTQVFVRIGPFTLDGSGNAAVPHGITNLFTVLVCQAFYHGAAATDFVPAAVASVDVANVNVAAGAGGAGKACMACLVFSIVPPGW